jgi:hypothetical protein
VSTRTVPQSLSLDNVPPLLQCTRLQTALVKLQPSSSGLCHDFYDISREIITSFRNMLTLYLNKLRVLYLVSCKGVFPAGRIITLVACKLLAVIVTF